MNVDPNIVVQFIQALIAAGITYAGVRYTGKRAERATSATQGSADLKAAAEEWRALKEDTQKRVTDLEKEQKDQRAELEEERKHSRRQDRELRRLRQRLTNWTRWAHDLNANWDQVRQDPQPPPFPDEGVEDDRPE